MSTVTLTVGIPASGKTTWARKQARALGNTVIVSRDDIRHAHGWKSGHSEDLVTRIHRAQIEAALMEGLDVIVADTNINPTFRRRLIKFCHEHGADVQIRRFDVGLDEAVLRDAVRTEHKVGADVVHKFYEDLKKQPELQDEFLPAPTYARYNHSGYPPVVVVDIDGTLAHMTTRGPYDEHRVDEDTYDLTVSDAVTGLALQRKAKIIVLSGRTEAAREKTEAWLETYGFDYDLLLMRKSGDQRPDYVIKNEIYDAEIIPKYDILAVFDDRDQVVRHLRKRGITVFQVAPGRF
jgi:predicted kinase